MKYDYFESMKQHIEYYDKEIASLIKQIKTLEERCDLYQKRRKEYFVALKKSEKRERIEKRRTKKNA